MNAQQIIKLLENKLKSGNSIPVTRIHLTTEEAKIIIQLLEGKNESSI